MKTPSKFGFLTLQTFLSERLRTDRAVTYAGRYELPEDIRQIFVPHIGFEYAVTDKMRLTEEKVLAILGEFYSPFGCIIIERDELLAPGVLEINLFNQGQIALGTFIFRETGSLWISVTCFKKGYQLLTRS
jgi:hypothetical protein